MNLRSISALAVICLLVGFGCSKPSAAPDGRDPGGAPQAKTSQHFKTENGVFVNDKGEPVCPVTGDVISEKGSYADYKGVRYYFCCDDCPPKFKKDPEKYANGKAILSGEAKPMGG
jgi:YHS domain-containing protein